MHDAGEDAYKCGRLLLHYNGACFASTTVCEHETRSPKKVKSSITAASWVHQSLNNCMRTGNAFVQEGQVIDNGGLIGSAFFLPKEDNAEHEATRSNNLAAKYTTCGNAEDMTIMHEP